MKRTTAKRTMGRTYRGIIPEPMSYQIMVSQLGTEAPLDPRNKVMNHSPSGFSWGYEGSGPAQAALAILCDAVGVVRARNLYQQFKRERIAKFDMHSGWVMSMSEVLDWAQRVERG
jgi:Family of unknown function (DUF6166)